MQSVRIDLYIHLYAAIRANADTRAIYRRYNSAKEAHGRPSDWRNTATTCARGKDPAGCKDEWSCVTSAWCLSLSRVLNINRYTRCIYANVFGRRVKLAIYWQRVCPFTACVSRYYFALLRIDARRISCVYTSVHACTKTPGAKIYTYTVVLSAREYPLFLAVSRVWIWIRDRTFDKRIINMRAIYLPRSNIGVEGIWIMEIPLTLERNYLPLDFTWIIFQNSFSITSSALSDFFVNGACWFRAYIRFVIQASRNFATAFHDWAYLRCIVRCY